MELASEIIFGMFLTGLLVINILHLRRISKAEESLHEASVEVKADKDEAQAFRAEAESFRDEAKKMIEQTTQVLSSTNHKAMFPPNLR